MSITIEAVYEDGVLKPSQPLPLKQHEKVRLTIEPQLSWAERTAGMVPAPADTETFNRILAEAEEGDPLP